MKCGYSYIENSAFVIILTDLFCCPFSLSIGHFPWSDSGWLQAFRGAHSSVAADSASAPLFGRWGGMLLG